MRQETRDTGELAARALAVTQAYYALGNERFQAEGATFIRSRATPLIRDANHVCQVTASTAGEMERLLARVEQEFAGFPHRRFDLDPAALPALEARLVLEGYEHDSGLVLLLEGGLVGKPKRFEMGPVSSEADWQAYGALLAIDEREYFGRTGRPADERVVEQMLQSRRAKSPLVRAWLAYVEGQAAAYCSSWEGVEGMGYVEDLFTHPEFRHRGLATSLVHHCVADCRSRGAGPVVIGADPTDTPKQMYAAMGFRPVVVQRAYWKRVPQ